MNDVNLLMSRIDAINSKSPHEVTSDDIDTLIAYHRRNRARKAAGEKPERTAKSSVDISALLNLPTIKAATALPKLTRRI